jgi:hypothetical protein
MADSATLQKAGDVSIDLVRIISANGYGIEITPQVLGIEIFEDIFAPFITGQIIVKDSQELTNVLPLIGEESLEIKLTTPGMPEETAYAGKYYIYKMGEKMKVAERTEAYVLFFISREAIIDLNTKTSRAYKGKVSDIVHDIIKGKDGLQSEKAALIEESKNDTMFIANFWNPIKSIQYACDNAYNEDDSPTYLFFETKYGLNWVTLSSLYKDGADALYTFKYDNYSADVSASGGSTSSIAEDYKRVIEINQGEMYNYLDRIKSGMYGSEIVYYDILTKQYVHTAYTAKWEDNKHLNDYPVWTPDASVRPKAVMINGKQYYNNFDGFDDRTSNTKIIQKRISQLAMAEAYKITITVLGRTDYTAGQKIFLEVPKKGQISKDDPDWLDEIVSGNYLISSVCHSVNRKEHKCIIELIKDSYMINLGER